MKTKFKAVWRSPYTSLFFLVFNGVIMLLMMSEYGEWNNMMLLPTIGLIGSFTATHERIFK